MYDGERNKNIKFIIYSNWKKKDYLSSFTNFLEQYQDLIKKFKHQLNHKVLFLFAKTLGAVIITTALIHNILQDKHTKFPLTIMIIKVSYRKNLYSTTERYLHIIYMEKNIKLVSPRPTRM